jgi:flagellar export protein FliJ
VREAAAAEELYARERTLLDETAQTRDHMTRSGCTGQELRWLDTRLRRGFERLERARGTLGEVLAREEQARRELAEETRRVEVLEQIRERRLAEHRRELGRREQAQIDEITLNRYATRRADGCGEEER